MVTYFIRKIWIILIFSILCSGLLVLEKIYTTNFVGQQGDFIFGAEMTIKNYEDKYHPFLYEKYLKDERNRKEFLTFSEEEFNYSNFDASWNRKTFLEKCKWLDQRIIVNNFGEGKYCILFVIRDRDVKNYKYCMENGERYLIRLCEYINTINASDEILFSKSTIVVPEIIELPRKRILIKYGIIGAFLGLLVSSTILVVLFKKRSKNCGT